MEYATLRDAKSGALVDARTPAEMIVHPYSAWDKAHFVHTKSENLDPALVIKALGRESFEDAWGAAADVAAANMKAELLKVGYTEEQIKVVASKAVAVTLEPVKVVPLVEEA